MIREYPELTQLKTHFGKHKSVPAEYELPVFRALSHFPELCDVPIEVTPVQHHPVPYHTVPATRSLFSGQRRYRIFLQEEADEEPQHQALFRNLPFLAQVGVLGHELVHVLQYEGLSSWKILQRMLTRPKLSLQRTLERGADIGAIEHGLGFELYTHALYIRSIEGYVEMRKELDILYLHPHEILEALPKNDVEAIRESA